MVSVCAAWGTPLPSSSPRDPHLCSWGVAAGALAWESSWTAAHCALAGLWRPDTLCAELTASHWCRVPRSGDKAHEPAVETGSPPFPVPSSAPRVNLCFSSLQPQLSWDGGPGYLVTCDSVGLPELGAVTARRPPWGPHAGTQEARKGARVQGG